MFMTVRVLFSLLLVGIITAGFSWAAQPSITVATAELVVTSPAFPDFGVIPDRYTCVGADASPPLAWRGVPRGAKTLALVVDDSDAPSGTFTHWIVYNIDRDSSGLPESSPGVATPAVEYSQAVNDFGHLGYNGPCPPPGNPHHYHFKLYALAARLELPRDATAKQLAVAMRGRILGWGEMIATFER
jgi:Raf kinase inhibitor-like YbhB/YbcL family protein